MPSAPPSPKPKARDKFKSEYYNGQLIDRTGRNVWHCVIGANLTGAVGTALRGRTCPFLLQLRSLVLQPFAPAALPAFFAITASADSCSTLVEQVSPGKVQNLSPRAARLYPMRLDDLWASLFVASLPPAPGLTASSCSCGREFATRFFRLRLAATPCVSLRLPSSAPVGSFHPTGFCPCWAHYTRLQSLSHPS
jgi:hypothetical protein